MLSETSGSVYGCNQCYFQLSPGEGIPHNLIEPTITWVSLEFSGYIWLDTKIVLKNESSIGVYLQTRSVRWLHILSLIFLSKKF